MKLYVIVFSVRRSRSFGAILNRYKMNMFIALLLFFLVCKDICKQFGRQSSSHIKAGFLLSLAFHNKRQLYCGFYTVQTLEDVRRPLKVIC